MLSRSLSASVLFFALVAGITLMSSLSLQGQSTYGSVSGMVADPSGAAIGGAQVTLTNTGTSEKHTQTTSDQGTYSFVNVIPGEYRIDIEKTGFKHSAHPNVVVQVQLDTHVETSLNVGAASEIVEVTGETSLLQTESASLGQVVEQRKANELPLNGRNIFNLITISPGAVAQGGSGGSPVGQNPFSWGNYQIGGSFANQGAEYLDGQPLNIGYINLPIVIPTQDSIGEYKVQYSNQGAECPAVLRRRVVSPKAPYFSLRRGAHTAVQCTIVLGQIEIPSPGRAGVVVFRVHPFREHEQVVARCTVWKCGVRDADSRDRAMEVLEQQLTHRCRALRKTIDHRAKRLVTEAREKVRLPVVQRSFGIGRVEHRVDLAIGHRADNVHRGRAELLDRLRGGLAGAERPAVADHQGHQLHP